VIIGNWYILSMTEKIIFDCDNTMGLPFKEVDDGLTLLYILGTPEIKILGVTTTFGNSYIEQVYSQTQKLAERMGLQFPILKGEGTSKKSPNTPAAQFLVESVNQQPHQISLLTTGPVGNLASAQKLDPNFFHKVKRIVSMGGYLGSYQGQAVGSRGLKIGIRYLHELNFSANPTAAYKTVQAPCPVTIFPGQVCLQAPFRWKNINEAVWWSPKFRRNLKRWLLAFGLYCGVVEFYLWDLLPAVFLTEPNLFETVNLPLGSTMQDLQDGLLIENPNPKAHPIQVGKSICNPSDFNNHLFTAWQRSAENYPSPQM
jgi:inosine-uridine nucleoside N-ribohydrolase